MVKQFLFDYYNLKMMMKEMADCGFEKPHKTKFNETVKNLKMMLADKRKFNEMCCDLFNSIPEDLKDNERNLMIMMCECIDE